MTNNERAENRVPTRLVACPFTTSTTPANPHQIATHRSACAGTHPCSRGVRPTERRTA